MDEVTARFIYIVTDLILPLIVGYILYRCRILSDAAVNRIIRINVIVFFTVLSLFSFWALPLTRDLALLPVFGCLLVLVPGALSWCFLGRRFHSAVDRGTHLISAMLSNIGTLCGICAYIIYGESGFAYAQICGACQNFLLIVLVFPIAQYYYLLHKNHGRGARLEGRAFLGLFFSWNQLGVLGICAGLALNAADIARPAAATAAFSYLIHVSAWFAMLPIGSLINPRRVRRFLPWTWDMLLIRFVFVPAIIFALSYPLISDPALRNSLLIFASAPGAINATLAARLYHLNVDYTLSVFLVTTTLYLTVLFPMIFFLLH